MKSRFSNIKISGISAVLPEKVFQIDELSKTHGEREIKKIINNTGISSVRVCDEGTSSSDLCIRSAELLIEKSNIDKKNIDGLIFVSQTRDFIMPQTSFKIQNELKLSSETICYDMPLGCTGYIQGLFQACLLMNSNSCENVLLLSGDTTSKYIDEGDRSLRSLFGDAGSATIISKGKDDIYFNIKSDGSGVNHLIMPKDHDQKLMCSKNIYMNGFEIFQFAVSKVPSLIRETIQDIKLNKSEITFFGFHQANKFMINHVNRLLKIDNSKSPVLIDGIGNTGPASIPVLLTELKRKNIKMNYSNSILCGFGVGLTWGSVYCNLEETLIIETVC